MSRNDALVRLHKSLLEKRDSLRRQLALDLSLTHGDNDGSGDEADAASDINQSELHSQLAAFESRELEQIDHAIELIRQGRYGKCEYCEGKIPVERLKALPFTTCCITCQQKQEIRRGRAGSSRNNWESAIDYEGSQSDRDFRLSDIPIE